MGEAKRKAEATAPAAAGEPGAGTPMTPEQGRRLIDDLLTAHRLQAQVFALMAPKAMTNIGAAMRAYVEHVETAFPGSASPSGAGAAPTRSEEKAA